MATLGRRLLAWTQRRMLLLLLATYAVGALVPGPGRALRAVQLGAVPWPGAGKIPLSLPAGMLAWLILVASLGARLEELRAVVRRPLMALGALVANAAWPILFGLGVSLLLRAWHDPDEAENVLVGLAMVGAMPIAGASTAWSQNAGGNLALSLSLVIGSTVLSPLVTPIGLRLMARVTHGDYAEDLDELAAGGAVWFVLVAVVAPTVLGLVLRLGAGPRRIERLLPGLKLGNLAVLLILNYTNAAAALPQVWRAPDWDLLAIVLGLTLALCVSAFAIGGLLGRAFGASPATRTALMFGLGMNNNGTGLVLASEQLADHPLVLVPIIFYNLVQQIVAGLVDRRRRAAQASSAASSAAP